MLELKGATVTVDAMHCQRDTARAIRDANADYLMQVKANQRSLHEYVELFFDEAIAYVWQHTGHAFHETIDKDHGRIERRRCWSTWDIGWLKRRIQDAPWPDLAGIVCVESERHVAGNVSRERRYDLTSRDPYDAEALLAAVRGHWAIENSLHWCLDVAFDEDRRRLRQDHAAENFSRVCRLATNLLRRDTTTKAGINARRKRAGWDHQFLLHLIQLA